MHTPVSWNSDLYRNQLETVKSQVYKNVDRLLANRKAERHRSVFQILVMLVSEEIQNIKKFFKANTDIEISKDSEKSGVGTMTAIASAINEWIFLAPAFEIFNSQNPNARAMTLERWQSKSKEIRPLPFERTAIKRIVQDMFTEKTDADHIEAFKSLVRNVTIEQFKERNPEVASIIDEAQRQAEN
jgi:hypothetical protein